MDQDAENVLRTRDVLAEGQDLGGQDCVKELDLMFVDGLNENFEALIQKDKSAVSLPENSDLPSSTAFDICKENESDYKKSSGSVLSDAMIAVLLSENANSKNLSIGEENLICVEEKASHADEKVDVLTCLEEKASNVDEKASNSDEKVDILTCLEEKASNVDEELDVLESSEIKKTERTNQKNSEVLVTHFLDTCQAPSSEHQASIYRCEDLSSSWTDDESSSSSDSSDCSDTFLDEIHANKVPKKIPNIKTKGELGLDDLPPIEDLYISVKESELEKIGRVYAIVAKLVVIQSMKDQQALDIDSVLFLSPEKPLGRIFDVFGPVIQPFYSIRFNTADDIIKKDISIDEDVYFAPEVNDVTSYVFVDELKKQKGSDASWMDNNEPPEEHLDFSDDEQERAARRKRQAKNRNRHTNEDSTAVSEKVPVSNHVDFSTSVSRELPVRVASRGINQNKNNWPDQFQNFQPSNLMSVCHAVPPPRYSPVSLPRVRNPFQISSSSPQPQHAVPSPRYRPVALCVQNPFQISSSPQPQHTVPSQCYRPVSLHCVRNPFQMPSSSPQPALLFHHQPQPVIPVQHQNISSPFLCSSSTFPNYQPPVFGQIPIIGAQSPGMFPPPCQSPRMFPPPCQSPRMFPPPSQSPRMFQPPCPSQRMLPPPCPSPRMFPHPYPSPASTSTHHQFNWN